MEFLLKVSPAGQVAGWAGEFQFFPLNGLPLQIFLCDDLIRSKKSAYSGAKCVWII